MLILLALSLTSPPAHACASCACGDPTLTTVGLDKPFQGRVRLSLEGGWRGERWSDDVGAWMSDEGRLVAGVSWSARDWLVLSVQLPMLARSLRGPDLSLRQGWGLGDTALRARMVAYRSPRERHLFGLGVGLGLPTSVRLRDVDGTPVHHDAQPGTGAWSPEASLWYGGFFGPWTLLTRVTGRYASPGFDDLRPGSLGLATLAVQAAPIPEVAARLGLDARVADADRRDGVPEPHTGGAVLAVTPGLLFTPVTDLIFTLSVQLPVLSSLRGAPREMVAPSLGVVLDL